jgi:hypothetical protein
MMGCFGVPLEALASGASLWLRRLSILHTSDFADERDAAGEGWKTLRRLRAPQARI